MYVMIIGVQKEFFKFNISKRNLLHSSIIVQQIHANNIQNNDTIHALKNKDLNHCCLNVEGKKLFIFSNIRIH